MAAMAVPTAQAQWVMVARAASGRIQRMEQQRTANDSGYDVASVILEAKADKVYETALNALKAHADKVTVTSTDAKRMMVSPPTASKRPASRPRHLVPRSPN